MENREMTIVRKRVPNMCGQKLTFLKVEQVMVHRFVTDPAVVELEMGMTKQVREKDWANLEFLFRVPCYVEEFDETLKGTYNRLMSRAGRELATLEQDLENGQPVIEIIQPTEGYPTEDPLPENLVRVKRGGKEIIVHKFITTPAKVGAEFGVTLAMPQYESAKMKFRIEMPCYAEEIDTYTDAIIALAKGLRSQEAGKIDAYRKTLQT